MTAPRPTIHFAIAWCQHGRGGCQAAASFSAQAQILSPDFTDEQDLDRWLADRAKDPSRRRCRSCRRPIAIKHFEKRIEGDTHALINPNKFRPNAAERC